MKNFARIINNVAVDVSTDPENCFHPSISVEFVEVPSQVEPQWRIIDGEWSAPPRLADHDPVKPTPPTIGPNQFYFLWTMAEQIAIDDLRETDQGIKLFMRRLDDPRTMEVVLADPTVQEAVHHTVTQLVAAGVIDAADAEARVAAILAGPAR